jgi:CubicO group peptidase (beta-lactamase class C family)
MIKKIKILIVTAFLTAFVSVTSAGWLVNPAYNPDGPFVDFGRALPEPSDFKRNGWQSPNDATLRHYFDKQLHWATEKREQYEANASSTPYVFESELQEFDTVTDNLAETGLVSYLFYEDGKIKVDKKSPKNRFGDMFNDSSQLIANSVSKSMVSYVLGHAICKGYIKDVNEKMDWWLLKDTLYDNQRLIDLINMRAGDQEYMSQSTGLKNLGNVNDSTMLEIMSLLPDTKPSNKVFNYSSLPPNIIINYIMHKVGDEDEYSEFLDDIFQNKIGIESGIWFTKARKSHKKEYIDGLSISHFYASRYDYLRIAKSILDDWNDNTCVGQYLKTIYEKREYKGSDVLKTKSNNSPNGSNHKYGGFFHTDYKGYWGSPNIVAMDGYGGQMIWINFDDKRIVVANAIHSSYDWKNIVADVVKNGLKE